MRGAERSAEALLRTNGGRTVLLRMPAPAVPGDEGEVLGLVTPTFQDVELRPAVFRKAGSTGVLLVAMEAVRRAVGVLSAESVAALFAAAAGVVVDGVLYRVGAVVAEQAFGEAYCYAVTLTE